MTICLKICEVRDSDKPNVKENLPTMYPHEENLPLFQTLGFSPISSLWNAIWSIEIQSNLDSMPSIHSICEYFLWTTNNGILYIGVCFLMCTTRCKTIGSQVPSRFPRKPILSFSSFIRSSLSLTQRDVTHNNSQPQLQEHWSSIPRIFCTQESRTVKSHTKKQKNSHAIQWSEIP